MHSLLSFSFAQSLSQQKSDLLHSSHTVMTQLLEVFLGYVIVKWDAELGIKHLGNYSLSDFTGGLGGEQPEKTEKGIKQNH